MKIFTSVVITLSILISCKKDFSQSTSSKDSVSAVSNERVEKVRHEEVKKTKEETIKALNDEILLSLKLKDYRKFATYIHPEKGIRFSMYAFLSRENKTFTKTDFEKYIGRNVKFTWGSKDGTGDLLIMSLKDYMEEWVFKRDFTTSEYSLNKFQGSGNSLNNLREIYPPNDFTENYIPGSEKYSGMDWNALRLVFEEYRGNHYVIAVVNDEWTI